MPLPNTTVATTPSQPVTYTPAPSLDEVRSGDRVLEKGQKGGAVSYLQRLLGIHVDAKFGKDTAEAVAEFQIGKGMQIDPGFQGKVGRFTLAALEQSVALPAIPIAPATAGNFDPSNRLDTVHPELRRRMLGVVAALAAKGVQMRITDGRRTFKEQDKLYQKGRHLVGGEWKCIRAKCAGTVTNARGGLSNHNYGLACDSYPVIGGKVYFDVPSGPAALRKQFFEAQAAIGHEGERLGLTWGGRWSNPYDPPHLQLFGQTEFPPTACLKIYRAHGDSLEAVWDEATRRLKERGL
jgi:peptidoglycan L-alanyl-D-glutamate endopeptidase CwlK